ncbi:OmpA family protein [Xylanimonas allomyrinae]|uniref:OmpA family protein n=2 Tax=Xylanimonas allomyrinae TaxID=2509459 RepID=A0A4P6EQ17_9MICO|nr:OmpA family protein [Xylanimonas allomyrinae]
MPSRSFPSASLASYTVSGSGDVEELRGDDVTSYATSGDVLFGSNEDTLRPEAATALQAILDQAAAGPSTRFRVEGHTDDVDTPEYNLDLSQRRAQAVADWLAGQGVDPSRITVTGYGLTHPRADNTTAEGRALNRRVVITVTE